MSTIPLLGSSPAGSRLVQGVDSSPAAALNPLTTPLDAFNGGFVAGARPGTTGAAGSTDPSAAYTLPPFRVTGTGQVVPANGALPGTANANSTPSAGTTQEAKDYNDFLKDIQKQNPDLDEKTANKFASWMYNEYITKPFQKTLDKMKEARQKAAKLEEARTAARAQGKELPDTELA